VTAPLRSALIAKVRQRVDIVGSTHITDAEIGDWLDYELAEAYERLVDAYGDYSVVYYPVAVTLSTATGFTVPADFFKLLRLDKSLSGSSTANDWFRLRRVNIRDETNWNQSLVLRAGSYARAYGYFLVDTQVRIIPQQQVIGTYQLLYYPTWRTACLTAGGDPNVSIGPSDQGWEEYAVHGACIKACAKEETDPSVFIAQKAAMVERLERVTANRNAGEAEPPPTNEIPWYDRGGFMSEGLWYGGGW